MLMAKKQSNERIGNLVHIADIHLHISNQDTG